MADSEPSPLARALGRLPTGLYIVSSLAPASARDGSDDVHAPIGFVGSFLMQVGIDPPVVCVAVGRARGPLEAMRRSGRFGVSILDAESKGVMGRFFRKYPEGQSPFDGLELVRAAGGTPVLAGALAWLECRITGEHETGDHVVLFGEVEDGAQNREGEPTIHLRKDGLGY